MNKHKVLIIGFGHHSKRIYLPVLNSMENVEIAGIVDMESQRKVIGDFLELNSAVTIPVLYLKGGETSYDSVTQFATELGVEAVIISTDPEHHVVMAEWAFDNGLHVLMDKPIYTEPNAALSVEAARSIHKEYLKLEASLIKARKRYPNLLCEVLSQRRYHPVYQLLRKTIEEGYKQTGCPITYCYIYHNDGQFRFPEEIRDIEYHGFTKGYGKASHSGYHFFDMFNWLTEVYREDFAINKLSCSSWANFPSNYLKQVKPDILGKMFKDYTPEDVISESSFEGYGEVDVMSRVQLKSNDDVITHGQIDLQHSGLSARSWHDVGDRDMYKGNGRVRHEQYYISMGPFLTISLTSWQGITFNKENLEKDSIFQPGHEFNVDLNIFRNKIIGGKEIESYRLNDLYTPSLRDYSRGHQEDARRNGITEFFELISKKKANGSSNLLTHSLSSQVMSTIYESVARKSEATNPLSASQK